MQNLINGNQKLNNKNKQINFNNVLNKLKKESN